MAGVQKTIKSLHHLLLAQGTQDKNLKKEDGGVPGPIVVWVPKAAVEVTMLSTTAPGVSVSSQHGT